MNDQQCIQIAEKVWRWKWYPWRGEVREHWEDGVDPIYPDSAGLTKERFIQEQVLSWSGFGRTVEAMADKLIYFTGTKFYWWNDQGHQEVSVRWEDAAPKELIEATHLAALEALKDV